MYSRMVAPTDPESSVPDWPVNAPESRDVPAAMAKGWLLATPSSWNVYVVPFTNENVAMSILAPLDVLKV